MAGKSIGVQMSIALVCLAGPAHATMGAQTMMERLDTNHDGKVSREEVRAAAGRKFDLIASKNGGHVTSVALSGRLSQGALGDIQKADASKGAGAEPDSVSRDQYVTQADKAFTGAHLQNADDAKSESAALSLGELSAPTGKDLIDLLQ